MKHTIMHFEIPAEDLEKLKSFYENLFGWRIKKTGDMDYYMIHTVETDEKGVAKEPGINGGMMKKKSPQQGQVNYIWVESVDEYAKKAQELGGRVLMEKQEVPQMGWFMIVSDPEGNVFGIWEDAKR